MFFFFGGGLEKQVGRVVKSGVGRCRSSADLVEYENVLKLFLVPVWRWPSKEPLLFCQNCKFISPQSYSLPSPSKPEDALRCRFCERDVEADFAFCPYCGSQL